MYQIGEVVSYGTTGICTIEDIRMESLSRAGARKQEYYVLRPMATPTCVTYVPTGNVALTGKMRPVLTGEAIDRMIDSIGGETLPWIEDTRQRADAYQRILNGGISGELLQLIGCLYLEKKNRAKGGRKFCATDEKLLSSAERIVGEEFAYALHIPEKEVTVYIAERIQKATAESPL